MYGVRMSHGRLSAARYTAGRYSRKQMEQESDRMSVIIKGEDMPKRCADCTCCFTDESDSESFCSVHGDDIPDIFNGRLDGCPLVELPEDHGRLIDADELIRRLNDSGNYVSPAIISYIEAAPTIIKSGD